jgi:signal transduction histidine kinase
LTALSRELRQELGTLRDFIAELQPPLLIELGLEPSVRKLTDDFTRRTGVIVKLDGWNALTERLPATVETAVFRIIQEALDNVREHAHANRVELRLHLTAERLEVTINDDGEGFDTTRGIQPGRRLGLAAMRDRAESLGGSLQIFSKPGRGVRVLLTAPLRMRVSPTQ